MVRSSRLGWFSYQHWWGRGRGRLAGRLVLHARCGDGFVRRDGDEQTEAEVGTVTKGEGARDRRGEVSLNAAPVWPPCRPLPWERSVWNSNGRSRREPTGITTHGSILTGSGLPASASRRRRSWAGEPMAQASASSLGRPSRWVLGWRVATNGVSEHQTIAGPNSPQSMKVMASRGPLASQRKNACWCPCSGWPPALPVKTGAWSENFANAWWMRSATETARVRRGSTAQREGVGAAGKVEVGTEVEGRGSRERTSQFHSQARTTAAVFPKPVGMLISRDSQPVPWRNQPASASSGRRSPQASRL